MPTLNVWLQIYMNKKNTKFIKITNIFFSEALSMCNQITNENTDNSAT